MREVLRWVRCGLAASLLAAAAGSAWAHQVSPMIYDLKPSGPGATSTVRIQNDNPRPITIEMVAERRDFDENGKESRVAADDQFVLFPPQAVIPAGKNQAIRVQYVGAPTLDKSVMYVVTVKQVPVALPANSPSGVQFVFNFGTLANVVPDGAKADVRVSSVSAPAGGALRVRLRNNGNKYANLSLGGLTLSNGGKSFQIPAEAWRQALGPSWLLPGKERVISLPAQPGIDGTAVTARFESDAQIASKK